MTETRPNVNDVYAAGERIGKYIHRTPVLTCSALDDMVGGRLFFKCENFQKVGAFKARGACNAVFSLSDQDASRGVVTHSSGNHAAALARAAKLRGIPAYIVMPSTAPAVKRAAVEGYGGRITECEPTQQAREATCERVMSQTGATLIHPYDDDRIIAGQGTAALELLEDVEGLDMILAPVGGGGLLSGTLIAAKDLAPAVKVIACEPTQADDAYRSWKAGAIIPAGQPNTIADGLRTSLAERTFTIIQRLVDDIVLAEESEIVQAMRTIWERMKIIVEPSAAVVFAALLNGRVDARGKRVGLILSGGNVDLARLPF
jgi:threonine dehydratase